MTQDNGTSDVRNSARAQGVESEAGDGLGVALHGQARVEDVIYLDVCQQLDHERAVRTEIAAERDRARDFAVQLEAENALLSEGVERLSSKIYKLRREAMDDLMALDRVLYAKAAWLRDRSQAIREGR